MDSNIQTQGRGQVQQRPQAEADRSAPHVVPPVDVFENEAGITLLADLPGVPREGLNVRVDGDSLFVEATAPVIGPEQLELVYGETQIPCYRRQFTLSRELDAARIDASLKDGVLRLVIPKLEEAKPRRIEVRIG